MPSPSEVARAHYRRQAVLSRDAASAVEALWSQMDPGDLDGSFAALGPRMAQTVALGQYAAAGAAGKYVADVVAAQGVTPSPLAALDPRGFAGTAADGGDLETMLRGAVIRTKALIASGVPTTEAMSSGRARAVMMAANETAQAGVSADAAAVALDGNIRGYRRMLVTPSCSRCILLAGKWFRWNAGFARHPRCDCRHVPDAGGLRGSEFNPEAHFDSMTRAQQDATFGKADAEALRNGADMGRVVNARQSTYTPTGRKTSRGTSVRATVEDCLRRGAGDRDATLAALDRAGYLRGVPTDRVAQMDVVGRWDKGRGVRLADIDETDWPSFDPDNPLSFYGDLVVIEDRSEVAAKHLRDLELLPRSVHERLRRHLAGRPGGGFYVGDRAMPELDDLGGLRGVRPRGWPEGHTWDRVPGAYDPQRRVIALGGGGHGHGAGSLALHETSHALDDALRLASFDSDFRAAWDDARRTLDRYGMTNPYFTPQGNPSGLYSEAFAEGYAALVQGRALGHRGSELDEHVRAALSKTFDPINDEGARLALRRFVSYLEGMEVAS